ncbi:MAG: HAMP domain-containing protein [Granulosicoccus sp.]
MARSSDAAFPLSLIRDKSFQVRQIRRVLFVTLFFIVQSTLVLGVFYHNFLGNLVAGNAPILFASEDMGAMADAVPPLGTVLSQWMITMLLINAVLTTAIAVYILRKLGNPILAIKRALNEIGDGNLGVRLRVSDSREFGELCEALNRALEQVHGKISEAREFTRVIESLDNQPVPDEKAVFKAMTECRDVLSYFDQKPSDNDESPSRDASGRK